MKPSTGNLRRVVRTRKDSSGDITHLCGGSDASWGPVPVADAINLIHSSTMLHYASVNGDDALVHVIDDPDGPYLRSGPDVTTANNLDDLPDR